MSIQGLIKNTSRLPIECANEYVAFTAMNAALQYPNQGAERDWLQPFALKFRSPQELNMDSILPGSLEARRFCFFDPRSALKAVLIEAQDEFFVVFGPVGSGESEVYPSERSALIRTQIYQAVGNVLGFRVSLYEQASALFTALMTHSEIEGKKVTLVGQSLGGSIAQYVGIKHQVNTVCFNSLQLGAGLQKDLGDDKLALADRLITHICVETDFVSDSRMMRAFDRIFSKIMRTPRNFGTSYFIPSAFKESGPTHGFVFNSLVKYLGFEATISPTEFVESLGDRTA